MIVDIIVNNVVTCFLLRHSVVKILIKVLLYITLIIIVTVSLDGLFQSAPHIIATGQFQTALKVWNFNSFVFLPLPCVDSFQLTNRIRRVPDV